MSTKALLGLDGVDSLNEVFTTEDFLPCSIMQISNSREHFTAGDRTVGMYHHVRLPCKARDNLSLLLKYIQRKLPCIAVIISQYPCNYTLLSA